MAFGEMKIALILLTKKTKSINYIFVVKTGQIQSSNFT